MLARIYHDPFHCLISFNFPLFVVTNIYLLQVSRVMDPRIENNGTMNNIGHCNIKLGPGATK
jgi:hypothetical protein